eukprot:3788133-Amphidinium_carterae.1
MGLFKHVTLSPCSPCESAVAQPPRATTAQLKHKWWEAFLLRLLLSGSSLDVLCRDLLLRRYVARQRSPVEHQSDDPPLNLGPKAIG